MIANAARANAVISSLVIADRLSNSALNIAFEFVARPCHAIEADPKASVGLIAHEGIGLMNCVFWIPFPEYPFNACEHLELLLWAECFWLTEPRHFEMRDEFGRPLNSPF